MSGPHAVFLDGQRLRMAPSESEQEHVMALEQGELLLLWQLHRPDAGQALQITTGEAGLPRSLSVRLHDSIRQACAALLNVSPCDVCCALESASADECHFTPRSNYSNQQCANA